VLLGAHGCEVFGGGGAAAASAKVARKKSDLAIMLKMFFAALHKEFGTDGGGMKKSWEGKVVAEGCDLYEYRAGVNG
jgi:hypothetical protein